MSNELTSTPNSNDPMTYQIRLRGHLGREWIDWFEGLTITLAENGDTLLTGQVIDQAALHGLLKKVRDLGIPLLSVNCVRNSPTVHNHSEIVQGNKEGSMNTNRKTAILVGVLFILGTVAGVLSIVFTSPVLNNLDFLNRVLENQTQLMMGALSILTMGLALAMIPAVIYPVLKKYNQTLALGYVIFRGGLETFTSMTIAICWLLLIPLSQEYAKAGAADAAGFQALGALLQKAVAISGNLTAIVFPLGAAMLYYLLYQSKLIPRWLSVWGFIGVGLHLVSTGLLGIFNILDSMSTLQTVSNLPIFLQEMVMAVWLIVKGFQSSAVVSATGTPATNASSTATAELR